MLNLHPVRLKWRESVSLRRFQNRNPLETDHFHHHAVEDESRCTPCWICMATSPRLSALRTAKCMTSRSSTRSGRKLWNYESTAWAAKFLDEWCRQVMRSRIEPMKKVGTLP